MIFQRHLDSVRDTSGCEFVIGICCWLDLMVRMVEAQIQKTSFSELPILDFRTCLVAKLRNDIRVRLVIRGSVCARRIYNIVF